MICNNDYDNVKTIEIFKKYKHKQLPKYGWLQFCFYCGDVTSNTIEYRKIIKERDKIIINVFLCKACEKEFNKKDDNIQSYREIIEKINNFLKRHDLYDCDNYI